jgi:hypothetical protein
MEVIQVRRVCMCVCVYVCACAWGGACRGTVSRTPPGCAALATGASDDPKSLRQAVLADTYLCVALAQMYSSCRGYAGSGGGAASSLTAGGWPGGAAEPQPGGEGRLMCVLLVRLPNARRQGTYNVTVSVGPCLQ